MPRIPRIVLPFLIGDLMAVALYIANVTVFPGFALSRRLFHMGHENNVTSWMATMQLFVVAVVLTAFAIGIARRREPGAGWLFLWPALFLLLSLDTAALLHERVPALLGVERLAGAARLAPVAFVGMLVLASAYLTRRYWLPHRAVTLMYAAGFAIFAIAAAGIQILTTHALTDWQVHINILAEEVVQMVAVTILLWASHDLLVRHDLRLDVLEDRRVPVR